MRTRTLSDARPRTSDPDEGWLDLERLAEVEFTSEDADHPIEAALAAGRRGGWRAGDPGVQTIRLVFDRPQRIRRIRLEFVEPAFERTQQYVLRWRTRGGDPPREIVRQQWNFSPGGSTSEVEDHRVDLSGVAVLELTIVPSLSGEDAWATLERLRLA